MSTRRLKSQRKVPGRASARCQLYHPSYRIQNAVKVGSIQFLSGKLLAKSLERSRNLIICSHIPARLPFDDNGYYSGADAESDVVDCSECSLQSCDSNHTKPTLSGGRINCPKSDLESCAFDRTEASSSASLPRHLAPPKVHRDRLSPIRGLFL